MKLVLVCKSETIALFHQSPDHGELQYSKFFSLLSKLQECRKESSMLEVLLLY